MAVLTVLPALVMGACAPRATYNPGDPVTDEYYRTIALRCALGDSAICPLVVQQTEPSASNTNLRLWLEADKLSLGDGTNVSSWTDSSSFGVHATQGTPAQQPKFQLNGIGGKPSVRFDDTATPGNNLILGTNYLFSSNDGITIMVVVSSTAEDVLNDYVLDFGNAGTAGYGLSFSANADGVAENIRMYTSSNHGGVLARATNQIPPGSGTIVVVRMKFSPAADKHLSIFVNGTLKSTNTSLTLTAFTTTEIDEAATRSAASGPVTIGGQSKTASETDRFLKGDLSLALWFDRALTDNELRGYECFASLKYGITVPQNCI